MYSVSVQRGEETMRETQWRAGVRRWGNSSGREIREEERRWSGGGGGRLLWGVIKAMNPARHWPLGTWERWRECGASNDAPSKGGEYGGAGPRSGRKRERSRTKEMRERREGARGKKREDERGEEKREVCLRPSRTAEASWITVGRRASGRGRGASLLFCSEPLKTDSVVQFDAADGLLCYIRRAGSVSNRISKSFCCGWRKRWKRDCPHF